SETTSARSTYSGAKWSRLRERRRTKAKCRIELEKRKRETDNIGSVTTTSSIYQRGLDAPVAGPNRRGTRRIAVIGAGACGICAAKYLLEVGFDVTVYEIGTQIGGLWCYENDNGRSSAYRTLHINTSRGVTRFSDLDFDAATQPFPDHVDMHRYLVRYATHFGVT